MRLVDLSNNRQSTMENLKSNAEPPSSSSASFSPWAWKASLLFWRKLLKKSPSKSHASKPPISTRFSQGLPPPRTKLTTSKQYYSRSNTNHFYYSFPDHNRGDDEVWNDKLGCYRFVTTKARDSCPCSGYATPTAYDYSPAHRSHMGNGSVPYYQLRRSHTLSPARLPLYIVS